MKGSSKKNKQCCIMRWMSKNSKGCRHRKIKRNHKARTNWNFLFCQVWLWTTFDSFYNSNYITRERKILLGYIEWDYICNKLYMDWKVKITIASDYAVFDCIIFVMFYHKLHMSGNKIWFGSGKYEMDNSWHEWEKLQS